MAVFDLFNRTQNRIEIIRFSTTNLTPKFTPDSTLSLTHDKRTSITSFPVEDGSNITDNIINENDVIDMECIVTDTPLSLQKSIITTGITAFTDFLPPFVQGAITSVLDSSKNRSLDSFILLEEIRNNKEIISIQTGFKIYSNMVITNLTITENVNDELKFRMTLEQIKYAFSTFTTVLIPKSRLAEAIKHTGTNKVDAGKDSVSTLNEQIDLKAKGSLLWQSKEFFKRKF